MPAPLLRAVLVVIALASSADLAHAAPLRFEPDGDAQRSQYTLTAATPGITGSSADVQSGAGLDDALSVTLASAPASRALAVSGNSAPQITALSTFSAAPGVPITISALAIDPDVGQKLVVTVKGAPSFLSLSGATGLSPLTATLSGIAGYADAGSFEIVWTVTDAGEPAATSSWTTTLTVEGSGGPDSPQTPGATIVGYTTDGPDVIVSEGANGIDATLGRWGFVYPNEPCGDPVSPGCTDVFNRIDVEIDVQTGGLLSFSYEFKQYGTPFGLECLSAYIYDPSSPFPGRTYLAPGTAPPSLECFGNPEPCWGTLWQSARSTVSVNLGNWPNRHVFLVIGVADCYGHGTDAQAHISSIAIRGCPVTPLSPLSAEDQLFEDNENRWDESGLTTEMRAALDCFRTKVLAAPGGVFDISRGSAYRTPGYQAHLQEVWDKYDLLKDKNLPDCQALKDQLAYEIGPNKHALASRPASKSNHPLGLAFDATVTGVNQDSLAWTCGLYRPYKDKSKKNKRLDCPHFELLGGRPKPTFGSVDCP